MAKHSGKVILLTGMVFAIISSSKTVIAGADKTGQVDHDKASQPSEPSEVNVDAIKQKYWARGNEAELGVIQNRTYSKTKRLEFGLMGGLLISDPFLDVKSLGVLLGYHFTEYFGIEALAFRHFAQPSAALLTFQQTLGATTNTNNPSAWYGVEALWSVMYGKLSLLGKAIMYYDLHLLPGIGLMDTESGYYLTPSLGVGQRFYLSKLVSIRVDYRLQYYYETFLEKEIVTKLGQPAGQRDNWSNVITLSLCFMLFGS